MKHRKAFRRHQNRSFHPVPGRTWKVSYLLSMWCPVCRRRDSDSGSRAELENLIGDVKRKGTSGSNREAESIDAPVRVGLLQVVMKRGNARGAKGAGHRHWRGSTGNGRNPMFNGRRQPSRGGTSRMTRECQVRICERLGVQFPGPTRQFPGPTRPTRKRLAAQIDSANWG